MKITVITDPGLKEELLSAGMDVPGRINWVEHLADAGQADVIIDLLFVPSKERISSLLSMKPSLVLINDIIGKEKNIPSYFVRFNGWKSFLKRSLVEATCTDKDLKEKTEKVFSLFKKELRWVADVTGFISPRVVSMIVNEAFFALDENISSQEEIDIAMKLGTNYPYGPFEWSEIIGLQNIHELLLALKDSDARYKPSARLEKEAMNT
jgi:3-hydroxybutyryl-CoA dehydrogenase